MANQRYLAVVRPRSFARGMGILENHKSNIFSSDLSSCLSKKTSPHERNGEEECDAEKIEEQVHEGDL